MAATYPAEDYPLKIAAGADFLKAFVYYPGGTGAAPKNWTGHSGAAQVRAAPGAPGAALVTFVVTLGADGSIQLATTNVQTAALSIRRGAWDLEITDLTGKITRLMSGPVIVTGQVTQ